MDLNFPHCLYDFIFYFLKNIYQNINDGDCYGHWNCYARSSINHFGVQFFQNVFGKILCMINLALWFTFIFSFFIASLDGKFKNIHYSNVINRFGIGTWVAGTSICGILFYKQFPNWGFISIIIAFINIVLWLIYIGISIKTFIEITRTKSFQNIHGILLLTTVSTQSIVLLLNTISEEFPDIINIFLLFLGFGFYLVCVFFILFRYIKNTWSIEEIGTIRIVFCMGLYPFLELPVSSLVSLALIS